MERYAKARRSLLRWLLATAGLMLAAASVHLFQDASSGEAVQVLGPYGVSTESSPPQSTTPVPAQMSAAFGDSVRFRAIDTWDRAAVVAAYESQFSRTEPAMGFTGSVSACLPGTTSPDYRESVIQRVNWYRAMAGLDPVVEDAQVSQANQRAAVMMASNGKLSHDPDAAWSCHSEEGRLSAGRSALALGIAGVGAIDAYMADPGANNREVGHRRTILYPQTKVMGTGDVPGGDGFHPSNTLQVFDSEIWSSRPDVREARGFVAWPPSGYVPPETIWTRWSFSLPETDFSSAMVVVEGPNGPIQTEIIARIQRGGRSAPESSIVWSVNGATDSVPFTPQPSGGRDDCYDISVSGARSNSGISLAPFEYTTCVLDMSLPAAGAPTAAHCPLLDFSAWSTPCWSEPAAAPSPFIDVSRNAYFFEPVRWMTANRITGGVEPTRYAPDALVSRAQSVTFLWRLAGEPAPSADAPVFSDVSPGSYYYDAVRWAAENHITNGVAPGEFGPDQPTTRAQFVTFLWRLADEPASAGHSFEDLTARWQNDSVGWAAANGITYGISPTEFGPNNTVTRGQAAAFIYRFINGL